MEEGFGKRGSVIMPKKRGAEKVEEHRGVTLMPTAYKVYAMMLTED